MRLCAFCTTSTTSPGAGHDENIFHRPGFTDFDRAGSVSLLMALHENLAWRCLSDFSLSSPLTLAFRNPFTIQQCCWGPGISIITKPYHPQHREIKHCHATTYLISLEVHSSRRSKLLPRRQPCHGPDLRHVGAKLLQNHKTINGQTLRNRDLIHDNSSFAYELVLHWQIRAHVHAN